MPGAALKLNHKRIELRLRSYGVDLHAAVSQVSDVAHKIQP